MARQLVARVEATVASFERELQLRRALANALLEGPGADDGDDDDAPPRAPGTLPSGWDASARLLLSAWVLEPHLEHEQLDLLLDSVAAEPSANRRGLRS